MIAELSEITPLALTLQPAPFSDPDWLFEVKHDGFRSLVYIQDECLLVSRKGNTYQRFKDLSRVLACVPHEVILDGELVCLDEEGQTLFHDLMFNRAPSHFYAFDILWLDGKDLRDRPLLKRKQILQAVVTESPQRLLYVDRIEEQGEQLFELICKRDMEGIVAKPKQSLYRGAGPPGSRSRIRTTRRRWAEGNCFIHPAMTLERAQEFPMTVLTAYNART
jgi:bifunctional non-homologous end joining protein LigD